MDIRNFSLWSERINVFQLLEEFMRTCYDHVTRIFAGAYVKPLGDGAMIIQQCAIPQTKEEIAILLHDALDKMCQVELVFRSTCEQFAMQCGEEVDLRLGWGVTRGFVSLLAPTEIAGISDYLSTDINKAAKYCKEAFPAGMVIDEVDFPECPVLPANPAYQSFSGTHRVFERRTILINRARTAVPVWVSLADDTPSPSP